MDILHYRYFIARHGMSQRQIAMRLSISEQQSNRELLQAQYYPWQSVLELATHAILQATSSLVGASGRENFYVKSPERGIENGEKNDEAAKRGKQA